MVGFYWGGEIEPRKRNLGSPYLGFSYERKFIESLGIETGTHLNFTLYSKSGSFNGEFLTRDITYLFTNIPVLLKAYTPVVNISGGLTANILTATIDKGDKKFPTNDPVPKNFTVGYLAKVSKSFNTKAPFVLEPELSIGNRRKFEAPNIGAALALKYKF